MILSAVEKKSAAEVKSEEERVTKLKKLREQGLITEKEYQKAIFENQ